MRSNDVMELADRVLQGDRRALARLITFVESRNPVVAGVMGRLYAHTGHAQQIGITGPPGAGKSTLADKLIGKFRDQDLTVGVVAIDPSSPFTGGALLGDRVRMMNHASDPGVFIRSLGSRGHHGGLSRATQEIVGLMDAFGYDVILIETVGVGQTELDVMDLAHTVVVVFVPESGDMVQTMKAGLTEIADLFVVNKCDRPGADSMVRELSQMIELNVNGPWQIPVVKTVAFKSEGVDELHERIVEHRHYLNEQNKDPEVAGRMRVIRFIEVFTGLISDRILHGENRNEALIQLTRQVYDGELNPYLAAQKILTDPALCALLADNEGKKIE